VPSIHIKEPIPEEELDKSSDKPTTEDSPPQVDTPPRTTEGLQSDGRQVQSPLQLIDRKFIIVSLIALVVIVAAIIGLINERRELKQQVDNLSSTKAETSNGDEAEAQKLKEEIGKYLQLPEDEVPTVATVVDASKVKNQSFFANSENGDKVLLFAKSGKAILYRPSTKKIIEVAPINLNNQQPESQPAQTQTQNSTTNTQQPTRR
jgi:hypothetical protein